MAGGCICCLAGPVFRTTLVRLLRQSDWQHLVLEMSEASPVHLMKVIDQLRSPPFDQYLSLRQVIEVLDPVEVPDHGGAHVCSAPATRQPATCAWLSPSWPTPRAAGGVSDSRLSGAGDRAADTAWASVRLYRQATGWAWQQVDPLAACVQQRLAPGETLLCQRWSADADRPSRQVVQAALAPLLAVPGLRGLHAVLQSHRSAYVWQASVSEGMSSANGANGAIGLPERNLSTVLRSWETVWRLDNRICLGLAQGTDLALLSAALLMLKQHWV
ncbi:MAG: GTP-binding protein [Lautropia sp.]|nr:GTP-binding protein [Lautropia sp.]